MRIEKLEGHCKKRLRQRGRSTRDLRIISKYGERHGNYIMLSRRSVKKHCGRLKHWMARNQLPEFKNRSRKVRALVCDLERLINWLVVVKKGEAITLYPANKKQQQLVLQGDYRPAV